MSLFSFHKSSDCRLVFDVGSGSVGGAIVLVAKDQKPTILYSVRSDIPFQEEATGSRLLSLMLRTLSQVVMTLEREGFEASGFGSRRPRVSKILISLSAPWTSSKTSILRLESKDPVLLTSDVFESLLRESEQEGKTPRSAPIRGGERIERELIRARVNGYETSSFYGKKAPEVEFVLFKSFSPKVVSEGIVGVIGKVMHVHQPRFHSFAFLLFSLLKRLSLHTTRTIAVDVSGEQTELMHIVQGVLVEVRTFPIGRNRFIRSLKRGTGALPGSAASFLKMYVEGGSNGKMLERVRKTLALAEEEWLHEFTGAVGAFSGGTTLPRSFVVTADPDVLPMMLRAIGRLDVGRFPIAPKAVQSASVSPDMLQTLVNWNAPHAFDPFIGIVAAFARQNHT